MLSSADPIGFSVAKPGVGEGRYDVVDPDSAAELLWDPVPFAAPPDERRGSSGPRLLT